MEQMWRDQMTDLSSAKTTAIPKSEPKGLPGKINLSINIFMAFLKVIFFVVLHLNLLWTLIKDKFMLKKMLGR